MLRIVAVSSALIAALACGGLVEGAHAAQAPARPVAKISPYSPEGIAILAQIKKLDRSIRFQRRMASERAARVGGADSDRYFTYSYGYGPGYYAGGYYTYGGAAYGLAFSPGSYTPLPRLSMPAPSGPDRGTVKYRRLVRERAALQAQLAPL